MNRTKIARWFFLVIGCVLVFSEAQYFRAVEEKPFLATFLVVITGWFFMLRVLDYYLPRKSGGSVPPNNFDRPAI